MFRVLNAIVRNKDHFEAKEEPDVEFGKVYLETNVLRNAKLYCRDPACSSANAQILVYSVYFVFVPEFAVYTRILPSILPYPCLFLSKNIVFCVRNSLPLHG